ncbi:DsbA family oxidoreductase [Nocardioides iriomotensis]|uniref:DsbA family oxidoreductase n=1 Tax=Nocardioides iriomotensis TaxID=715784 RepID=A0A4Q5J3Z9_9ACTN|nr:DsbA family oxidoreductase [Nocardioides iriomotensis]RYU12279.1 DsbA family oxidoreductase [Nocardioides iriomotensis]
MRIEIWSDVVCPWCFIGKRRLESALAAFPHRDEVEVEYRSFELDPSAPTPATEPVVGMLARKYGVSVEQAGQMQDQVTQVAAEVGLEYHLDRTLHANTVDAHRLLHLALAESGPRVQAELKEALMTAYFTRAEDVTDHDVLRKAASDAGLDPSRVDVVLASREYADAVRADVDQARAFGASGVPFFVVDRKFGVSGAQPVEVFTQVLERAWADSHPQLQVVGDPSADGADGAVCGPEGCD